MKPSGGRANTPPNTELVQVQIQLGMQPLHLYHWHTPGGLQSGSGHSITRILVVDITHKKRAQYQILKPCLMPQCPISNQGLLTKRATQLLATLKKSLITKEMRRWEPQASCKRFLWLSRDGWDPYIDTETALWLPGSCFSVLLFFFF